MIARLQAIMADEVGPLRTATKLERAVAQIAALAAELGERPPAANGGFDLQRLEWFDLRNMLTVARAVAQSALNGPKAAAPISARIFRKCCRNGSATSAYALRDGALQVTGAPAAALAS